MSTSKVLLGTSELTFKSSELEELEDCNDILDNRDLLLERLHDKGYLFIRQLHDRNEVLEVRKKVLEHLYEVKPSSFDPTKPLEEGILDDAEATKPLANMEGRNSITHSETLLKVFEGERVKNFFRVLFNEEPKTFDFKWLRAIHKGGFTGAHVDNVYMSRGTNQLLTCWTPIGDVTMDMGTLAMCEGSHRLPEFSYFQETYGSLDLEKEGVRGSGWFTEDANEITTRFGGKWKTTNFRAGDVLVFTQRWLPASEPADPRFVGNFSNPIEPKYGIRGRDVKADEQGVSMETKEREWGLV